MLGRIVGLVARGSKANAAGVVLEACAAERDGRVMDAMGQWATKRDTFALPSQRSQRSRKEISVKMSRTILDSVTSHMFIGITSSLCTPIIALS